MRRGVLFGASSPDARNLAMIHPKFIGIPPVNKRASFLREHSGGILQRAYASSDPMIIKHEGDALEVSSNTLPLERCWWWWCCCCLFLCQWTTVRWSTMPVAAAAVEVAGVLILELIGVVTSDGTDQCVP